MYRTSRTTTLAALVGAASAALLAGCTLGSSPGPDAHSVRPGPVATSTAAPDAAARLA